jgi:hypothetical protein
MLKKRKGERQLRLAVNDVSLFPPGAGRTRDKCPRCAPAKTIERVAAARLPAEYGEFSIIGYRSLTSDEEFVALLVVDCGAQHGRQGHPL